MNKEEFHRRLPYAKIFFAAFRNRLVVAIKIFTHTKKKELNQALFVKHLGCVRVLADLRNQSQ
jgi:hypothetical protein